MKEAKHGRCLLMVWSLCEARVIVRQARGVVLVADEREWRCDSAMGRGTRRYIGASCSLSICSLRSGNGVE